MQKNQEKFDLVSDFIKSQIAYGAATYIQQMPYGYKINGYMIKKDSWGSWQLFDRSFHHRHDFFDKKYAILAAILLIKDQIIEYNKMLDYDRRYSAFYTDKQRFLALLKKNPDKVYIQDRIDRIDQELESMEIAVSQIAKSLNLQ